MGTLTICRVSKALPSSRAKVEVIRTLTSADVDDANVDSLLACQKCCILFLQGTYSASFDEADHGKYLDLKKFFTNPPPGKRPSY